MDRSVAMFAGAALAILSLWWTRSPNHSPSQSFRSDCTTEPARLDLSGVALKPLSSKESPARRTASLLSHEVKKRSGDDSTWVTPEMLTPSLAVPKDAVIELPSAKATPAPVERLPSAANREPPKLEVSVEPLLPTKPSPPIATKPVELEIERRDPIPAAPSPRRAPALGAAVERADQMTAEAMQLCRRGAVFSARAKFLQAVRGIAAAHDQMNSNTASTMALNAALRAIEESHDFEVHDLHNDPVNVANVVAGHRTNALENENLSDVTPIRALERYQAFAIEKLTAAMGGEQAASMALFGLGRISSATGKANPAGDAFGSNDALVWYHAALMTDPQNYRAAHELGSLYARRGEWDRAKTVLQRAAALYSHPTTWSNLAIVHARLGEHDWAAGARARANSNASPGVVAGNLPPIEWVDPKTFAKSTSPNESFFPHETKPQVVATPAAKSEPRSSAKPKLSTSWLPWKSNKTNR
jgi:hypothetical protein